MTERRLRPNKVGVYETPAHKALLSAVDAHFKKTDTLKAAEIGVAQGWGSAILLKNFPNLFLYMIDSYLDNAFNRDMGDLLRLGRDNTNKYSNRRAIFVCSSAFAEPLFEDESLDFVFIDAGHRYKSVKLDLDLWEPKVKKGGLLVGHDYDGRRDKKGTWGVKKAVDEYAERYGYDVQVYPSTIWSCVKGKE